MINGIGAIGGIDKGLGTDLLSGLSNMQAGATPTVGSLSFMDALGQVAGDTASRLARAESVSMQALQGDVPTRDVVDAVMSAEQSLQAAIAIRDKIVTAYLDLSRMAI